MLSRAPLAWRACAACGEGTPLFTTPSASLVSVSVSVFVSLSVCVSVSVSVSAAVSAAVAVAVAVCVGVCVNTNAFPDMCWTLLRVSWGCLGASGFPDSNRKDVV